MIKALADDLTPKELLAWPDGHRLGREDSMPQT